MTNNYLFQTYLPLIADLACFFVWFSMPTRMLPFRKERCWLFFTAIGINMIFAVICRAYPILLTTPFKTLILMVVLLIYMFLCYKETVAQKLIAFALWLVTITLADMMAVVTMSLIQINLTEPIGGLPVHFISGIITAVFSYFLMFATSILYNKIRHKNVANKMWQFQVVIISQLMFMFAIGYCSYKNDLTIESMVLRTPAYMVLLFITAIVAVLADVFLYRILLTNSQNYELKRELEIMQVKERLELEYYEKLKNSVNETRKLNHDFSNAVSVIEGIINSPDIQGNQKLASSILDEVKETLRKNKVRYYCENELINLIIINKTEGIIEAGIDFSANLNIPNNIKIKNFDLCRIFTNIIDNACDASLAATNRKECFIVLSSQIADGYILITCENYYDTPVNKNGDKFVSSKEDHKGLGIKIIKEIAKSYSGNVKIKHINNIFSVTISLKIN